MAIHTQDYENVSVLVPPGDLAGEARWRCCSIFRMSTVVAQ